MLSFSQFIVESRILSKQELESTIAKYKKDGEILNPQFVTLKKDAARLFGKEEDKVREEILSLFHSGNRSEHLNTIYYTLPHDSIRGLGKLSKTITKIEKSNPDQDEKKIIGLCKKLISDWKAVADDIEHLKTKVVKVTQKREQAREVKQKELNQKFADSSSLIKVLESHLNEYKKEAEKRANQFIANRLDALKKVDWDLNKLVPPAKTIRQAQDAKAKRAIYFVITSKKPGIGYDEDIRVINHEGVNRYIELSVKGAEESYHQFVQKMITKIGKPVIDAKLTGNIWTNAKLEVTTSDGESQVWNTKMIINFSKFQKMFNQFPTKRAK